ncbi:MAG: septal ring lytic transglycosylase RlpA family protein [Planctomycetia bacterium]|nr:septal ring lytic transglycosylase RlpA family protein [Planctomycetia bacterium]
MNNRGYFLRLISFCFLIILGLISCAGSNKNTNPNPVIIQKEPEAVGDVQYGISSYYAEKFHGKRTANGEIYDMYGVSGAHKTLPLNSIVKVTNLENNKELIIRINDRGPFIKDRIFDCSYGAAVKLEFISKGTAIVKVEVLEIGNDLYKKE